VKRTICAHLLLAVAGLLCVLGSTTAAGDAGRNSIRIVSSSAAQDTVRTVDSSVDSAVDSAIAPAGQGVDLQVAKEAARIRSEQRCSVRLTGGWVVDGSGGPGYVGEVLLHNERILLAVDLSDRSAVELARQIQCEQSLDVNGLVVAPGFINMLSWASATLLVDPRALSDVMQGVTLEVMGEGRSKGPFVNAQSVKIRRANPATGASVRTEAKWRTLGGYFDLLSNAGIGVNVASYVGATTIREYVLGASSRVPRDSELKKMRQLVAEAMQEGAMGVGSSLIYAPANYAETPELTALASEAAQYGGGYISHLRSEGRGLVSAVRELIQISEGSGAPAEIYHLKAMGKRNWWKLDTIINEVEAARARGLKITANMYPYTVAATGLDAVMPPWVQLGGIKPWIERLKDPEIRAQVVAEMRDRTPAWENFLLDGPQNARLLSVRTKEMQQYVGMTLAEIAQQRGVSAEDAAIDLVIADGSKTRMVYNLMSEANVEKQLKLDWVSIGSDASAPAAERRFKYRNEHPRTYGAFSRLLGKYVREDGALKLEGAIHQMTGLPAANLGLRDRGKLAAGYYADLAIFDAGTILDQSTFKDSHRYAKGMQHVFVNGKRVVADGEPTGVLSGQIVRGPGWNSQRLAAVEADVQAKALTPARRAPRVVRAAPIHDQTNSAPH